MTAAGAGADLIASCVATAPHGAAAGSDVAAFADERLAATADARGEHLLRDPT